MVVTKGCLEVLTVLEHVVLSDKMRKNKATRKLMTKQEKIDYVTKWKIKNKHILKEGGLLAPKRGDAALLTTPLKILCGIFFSIHAARMVVPHFQRVFQADACHTSFGKYTLYHVMAPPLIATHFQWHLQSSLGTKTRMDGFSFGNLPRVYIRHSTGLIQPSSPIKPRI